MPPSPLARAADGVRISLRVTPGAARDAVGGVMETAGGGSALKVSVTAVPEAGKANAAVIALLAKTWKLPKSGLSVVAGLTDRNKILHAAGDPAELAARLAPFFVEGNGDG